MPIHMPKNTPMGFYIAGASFLFGFGIVWHILWLTILSFVGIIVCIIVRSFDTDTEYHIPVEEIMRVESKHMYSK